MRCKIVRFQKLMWRNMMRSIKSQKASVLHYNIDYFQNSKESMVDINLSNKFVKIASLWVLLKPSKKKKK